MTDLLAPEGVVFKVVGITAQFAYVDIFIGDRTVGVLIVSRDDWCRHVRDFKRAGPITFTEEARLELERHGQVWDESIAKLLVEGLQARQ